MNSKDKLWYGGDYNPDQWSKETWVEDFKLFEEAGVTILTLPVFSWARIQKDEDSYDFEWLIDILKMAKERSISICLATSTAVQPSWLSHKYPDILQVDNKGLKRRFGGRVSFCPNSPEYKKAARNLVEKMTEIAKDFDNVVMWHIGNEYDNYCYCDHCKSKFQQWAKAKYKTIENLNSKWLLNFWGHQIYDFSEIEIPDFRTENWEMNGLERTNFQTILLDYKRFMNESILSCYLNELEIIRDKTPNIPVTTNFMGTFKPLDYFRWAKHLDYISWDHYPGLGEPSYKGAMLHDLMRSLKKDKAFWLMEQSPSQQNWSPYNTLKRPGELRLQSFQTIARGGDAVMYFQMRRSVANCEKFHGALIDHVSHSNTRVFRECQQIGQEVSQLQDVIGSVVKSEVGIVFDWENWWAIEMSSGPSIDLNYIDSISTYYASVYRQNKMVDFIWEEDNLDQYKVIIAPMLYLVTDRMYKKLEAYVANGGKLVLTTFSGIVDENDHVTTKGYPGKFREMAGIWVEEIDGLLPEMTNTIEGYNDKEYTCHLLCDLIHLEGAKELAVYGKDFYAKRPVVTMNNFGEGSAYYIGTQPDQEFINQFLEDIMSINQSLPETIEKSTRYQGDVAIDFYINYGQEEETITIQGEWINLVNNQIYKDNICIHPKDAIVIKKVYN